jgi:ArsR family transcriptional regulator
MKMEKTTVTEQCSSGDHDAHKHELRSDRIINRTAEMFRALGDASRLRMMELLFDTPHCVSELAEETGESMSTISQRLKILCQAGLVNRKRSGKHIYYSLSDHHVFELLENAFEHTIEHNL